MLVQAADTVAREVNGSDVASPTRVTLVHHPLSKQAEIKGKTLFPIGRK